MLRTYYNWTDDAYLYTIEEVKPYLHSHKAKNFKSHKFSRGISITRISKAKLKFCEKSPYIFNIGNGTKRYFFLSFTLILVLVLEHQNKHTKKTNKKGKTP